MNSDECIIKKSDKYSIEHLVKSPLSKGNKLRLFFGLIILIIYWCVVNYNKIEYIICVVYSFLLYLEIN